MAYRSKEGIQFTPAAGKSWQAGLVGFLSGGAQGAEEYVKRKSEQKAQMSLEELKQAGEERRAHIYGQYQVAASAYGSRGSAANASEMMRMHAAAASQIVSGIEKMAEGFPPGEAQQLRAVLREIKNPDDLPSLGMAVRQKLALAKSGPPENRTPAQQEEIRALESIAALIENMLTGFQGISVQDDLAQFKARYPEMIRSVFGGEGEPVPTTSAAVPDYLRRPTGPPAAAPAAAAPGASAVPPAPSGPRPGGPAVTVPFGTEAPGTNMFGFDGNMVQPPEDNIYNQFDNLGPRR